MKKLFICIIALVATIGAGAQNRFEKGDRIVGAQSTGIDLTTRYNDGRGGGTIEWNAGALGRYFVLNRLAVDVNAGADYAKERGEHSKCNLAFGAGVRYYPVGNLFAALGYTGIVPLPQGRLRSYLGLKVGYDVFLAKNVFFEPAVYLDKRIYGKHDRPAGLVGREKIIGLSLAFGVRF